MRVKVRTTRALVIFLLFVAFTIAMLAGTELLKTRTTVSSLEATHWDQIPYAEIEVGKSLEEQSQGVHTTSVSSTKAIVNYRPKYQVALANPTNYGERFTTDINGLPVYNKAIVVIHETVNSAQSAINFFQTPHSNEKAQASYHALIKLDGTVVYIVPPEKRAFGAGNSVFVGSNGAEAVKTHAQFPASVNNFAYHVAFETPPDGRNHKRTHSGYTDAQYQSVAWLIAQSNVPDARVTTHRAVDRSGTRLDPRSFNFNKFLKLLRAYRIANAKESGLTIHLKSM